MDNANHLSVSRWIMVLSLTAVLTSCGVPNEYLRCVIDYSGYHYYNVEREKILVPNPGTIVVDSNKIFFDPHTAFIVRHQQSTKSKTLWRDRNFFYTLYWPRNREFSVKFRTRRKSDVGTDLPSGNLSEMAQQMGEEVQYPFDKSVPPYIYKFYVTKITIK